MDGTVEAAIRTPTGQSGFQPYQCTASCIGDGNLLQLTFTRTVGHTEIRAFVIPEARHAYITRDHGSGEHVVLEYGGTVITIRPTQQETCAQWCSALTSDRAASSKQHSDQASHYSTVVVKRSRTSMHSASSSSDRDDDKVCACSKETRKQRYSSLDGGLTKGMASALSLLTPHFYLRNASSDGKIFAEENTDDDDVFFDCAAEPRLVSSAYV